MTRIKMFGAVALALGAAGAFARCERQQVTALEARQHELAVAVGETQRAAQAGRIERDALTRLALRSTQVEPRAPDAVPAVPAGAPAESSPPAAAPLPPAEYTKRLDGSFAAETVDTAWEHHASETVTARLSAAGDGSLRSIECRASMCRLVTDDAGRDQAWRQIHLVIGNPGDEVWSGAYFSRVEDGSDGRPQRVTYLFRNGTALPML